MGSPAEPGVIVGVLVAGEEAEEPLADNSQQRVIHLAGLTRIAEKVGHGLGPSEPLIELADGQQAGVGTDEPAAKIGDDGFTRVKIEGELLSAVCHAEAPLPCGSQASRTSILRGFGGLCYAQTVRIHE